MELSKEGKMTCIIKELETNKNLTFEKINEMRGRTLLKKRSPENDKENFYENSEKEMTDYNFRIHTIY